ncbi:hypothetical protein [Kitasatospora sp. NBC_01539]|uniref:hypothetical protein n=1 Tax=Kitasatospora sp. NBC_01539 TaxID=2903577 RepID=UPI00386029D8
MNDATPDGPHAPHPEPAPDPGQAYAPVSTLRGLLQRGRGLGAAAAPRDSGAAAPVHEMIRQDWSWDSLVDERHLYLARLVRDLDLPTGPIADLLTGDADAREQATGVLELLALSGSLPAREALRTYIREGEHWTDVLEAVARRWPAAWWDDLAGTARARLTGEEPLLRCSEPWTRWGLPATAPAPPPRPRVRAVEVEASSRRLVAVLADPAADPAARAAALLRLAHRPGRPDLLPLVPSLGSADGERPLSGLPRAVSRIGAPAVPAAREWAADGRPWLARIGLAVLARHGEPRDLPVLVAALEANWRERAWCGPETLAAGLARCGPAAAEAVPVLRRFWLRTPHSYERPAYLRALAAIDPSGLDEAHVESLWDCQAEARLLGIAEAPDRPGVREQVAALRDDPMEEPEVRAAAARRSADAGG